MFLVSQNLKTEVHLYLKIRNRNYPSLSNTTSALLLTNSVQMKSTIISNLLEFMVEWLKRMFVQWLNVLQMLKPTITKKAKLFLLLLQVTMHYMCIIRLYECL